MTIFWNRYDFFFWASGFFLLGVLLASATESFSYKFFWWVGIVIVLIFLLRLKTGAFSYLGLFILVGAIYFHSFTFFNKSESLSLNQKTLLRGVVQEKYLKINNQELIINLENSNNLIKIITWRYPDYQYGDFLEIKGKIKKSQSAFFDGTIYWPTITILEKLKGPIVKNFLFNLRNKFQKNLKNVLPYDKAVFLSGLTVGGRSEFSSDMQEKFKLSGTTHLVALSGMNISIIVSYLSFIFGMFFSRRLIFILTSIFIILFVIMTGAEASIVRAAVMAIIVFSANHSGRAYNIRNSLMAAALVMTFYNPKILIFDAGFQLSFLAMIGISYLTPKLNLLIKKNFFLKRALFTTLGAEAMTIPYLIIKFGQFSIWSIFSNILLEIVVPLTMALGFLVGMSGFFSYYLSLIFAVLANILLTYELAVINFFAIPF